MSVEARVYHCPTCGGPNREAARRCEYCNSPIATVRCAKCLHVNPAEALHCTGCGQELGERSEFIEREGSCPECRSTMNLVDTGEHKLLECDHCGGQFIGHAQLRSLLERREMIGQVVPSRMRPSNPLQQKVVYRPCPSCSALMHRRNFGNASGIIVDICGLHGIFFDLGELPGVLAFVARGGLERARAAEREVQRKQRIELHARPPAFSDQSVAEADLADFAAAVSALVSFIASLLDRVLPARKEPPQRFR